MTLAAGKAMSILLSPDIRTVILLLFSGNVLAIVMLAAYRRKEGLELAYRRYFAGKIFQAFAWMLIGARGTIPDWLSADIGNGSLYVGFAFEGLAFALLEKREEKLTRLYASVTITGIFLFTIFSTTPALRVALSSASVGTITAMTAVLMLGSIQASRLRVLVACFYIAFSIMLAYRVAYAVLYPNQISVFQNGPIQALTYLMTFAFTLAGGAGFLLLLKEQSDSALAQAVNELQIRESLLTNIFNTSSVAIFLANDDGFISMANQRMAEMFGRSIDSLIGIPYLDCVSDVQRDEAQEQLSKLLSGEISFLKLEREYSRPDGSHFWGQLTATHMHDGQKIGHQLVGVIADITDLKLAEVNMRKMAHHDPLTGLANRALFSDRLQQAMMVAKRDQTRFALLYIDLDKFKLINDTFGHQMGDKLLQEVALRISRCVRDSDIVARVGGDEFVVLLRSVNTTEHALLVAEKVRIAHSKNFKIHEHDLSISCSIGIAMYPDDGTSEAELSAKSDEAMYMAKHGGRNQVQFANATTTSISP